MFIVKALITLTVAGAAAFAVHTYDTSQAAAAPQSAPVTVAPVAAAKPTAYVNPNAELDPSTVVDLRCQVPTTTVQGGQAAPAAPAPPTAATAGLPNLNTITAAELDALPVSGLAAKRSQHIIDYRTAHGGRFASVDELDAVPYLTSEVAAKLKPLVTV